MSEEEKVVTSGVDEGSVAGDQEVDYEQLLFGNEEEETGVEEEGVAAPDPEVKDDSGDDIEKDPKVAEAFAKRLAQKEGSLRESIRAEVMAELEKTKTTPAQQQQGAPVYKGLSKEEIERLADDLEASPKLVRAFVELKMESAQNKELLQQANLRDHNRLEYNEGMQFAEQARASIPSLPEWDGQKLHEIRMAHYNRHGTTLPWKQAYQTLIAEKVVSGDLPREAQQEVITQIKERDKTTVGIKTPATQKLDIWDIPDEKWARMKADAAAGKYTNEK